MADSAYEHLFGRYFIEIGKFFGQTIQSYREQNGEIDKLKVYYGSPSAVFKKILKTNNKVMDLPFMNFKALDFQRDVSQENPFVRLKGKYALGTLDGDFVSRERAPQVWSISFQFNFFTAGYIERDHIISNFYAQFPGADLFINYQHDPGEDPDDLRWIHIRPEDNFQDETEIESVPEKETRDIIRTTMSVKMTNAILFYPSWIKRPIKYIQTEMNLMDPEDGTLIDCLKHKVNIVSLPGEPLVFEIDIA